MLKLISRAVVITGVVCLVWWMALNSHVFNLHLQRIPATREYNNLLAEVQQSQFSHWFHGAFRDPDIGIEYATGKHGNPTAIFRGQHEEWTVTIKIPIGCLFSDSFVDSIAQKRLPPDCWIHDVDADAAIEYTEKLGERTRTRYRDWIVLDKVQLWEIVVEWEAADIKALLRGG